MKKFFLLIIFLAFPVFVFAGTKGKIAGSVTDAETGEVLPGANVIIEGTTIGAATNLEGYYVILNVPPGTYRLKTSMMGYATYTVTDVRVYIDLTTAVDFKMKPTVLPREEVVVIAERSIIQKDVSASWVNIEATQIEALPAIQKATDVIGLQSGILGMSIRGGGSDQTAFMVDGITLRDERTNEPYTGVSLSSIEEIQIQTGGFNAEYGNIRSGVVNVVTKEGSRDHYSGTVTIHYSPPAPKHFGPSGYDPNSYWNRPFLDDAVCWTGTESGAWDEYTQRQYPSFEGWIAVSERTLQDDDPNNDLTPEAAQQVYKYQHRRQGDIKKPDYNIDLGFGGPVPLIGKSLRDLRFYFSHRQEQNMYLIPLSRDGYNDNISQLKLVSTISPTMKLSISGLYGEIHAVNNNNNGLAGYFYSTSSVASVLSQRSYITAIMYGTDYWCPTHIYRHMVSTQFTHALSSRTFYEIGLERTGNLYRTFPNPLRDTTKIIKIGNNYWLDEAPYGYMPYPSSGIDGLRMGVGMSNSRDYSKIFTTTGRFDFNSQINANNQIKTGVKVVYNEHNVEYGSIDLTLPSGRPWSIWRKTPVRTSAYIQDKLEFEGCIANIGLRLNYIHAGGEWYDLEPYDRSFYSSSYTEDIEDQLKRVKTKKFYYLSPRLGISHPITENAKLYFNYGHFRSMPEAERLYIIQRFTDGSISRIGNPNNTLSKTVAYELGYEHNLFNQFLLHLAAYYKDVTDQPNWIRYTSVDRKVNYLKADENFYEDIRGFEISVERRSGTWITGFINYTYMVSTSGYFDKLRYYENPAEQREYDRQNIYQEKPIPRPYFRANIDLHTPSDFGPKFATMRLLGDWHTSLLIIWREGWYSTWTRGASIPGIQYNVQWPDYLNVDMRWSRDLRLGKYNIRFFLDISNLLNRKIFSSYAFSDGNDYRDYMDSLLWPKKIGEPLGYTQYGNDRIGDLRPDNVEYKPLEPNPDDDPEIEARNKQIRETKSYIDNPNLKWLYYLNPRDIFLGIRIYF